MTDAAPPPVATTPGPGGSAAPARADGAVLIGEMQGSGYRTPPALARRADGQTVQLTPLLYATLSALDGHRTYDEIAAAVAHATGKPVSADNARELVEKLRPTGLLAREDGSEPDLPRSNPLLGLRFKVAVTDEEKTRRLTAPFAALFHPVVALPLLLAFAWITWWVLFDKGLASATHEAFARPGLLLAVLAVTVLSAGFHEFGHAAAARRGGATPGVMGAGLYLVWPAFYTDVTDSYRLGRVGRLRTDLGGLYFNAIVAVRDRRRLVGDALRRDPAAGGDADPPDAAPAAAVRPVRRLPRAGRPHRRARPLRAHRPRPAQPGARSACAPGCHRPSSRGRASWSRRGSSLWCRCCWASPSSWS